ncbi:ABC transporter ATP-binding protein [Symbioplanes lichenis]|uniref:ABC transporter ATP-binding protein n=1 Tax=Symbioplanes lichenis TaxID=1629072 RepID=UPI002738CF2D|nr:ATP-binding cassette domain-containing protein [Actinoplanes lichenis]
MISIEHLSKSKGRTRVLHDVSFTARPGRVTGFLGPNGAGKTTTLRILLGLDRTPTGHARIHGHRYADLPRPLTRVGALLDGSGAHPARTCRGHLHWLALSNGLPRARVDEVLELTGLAPAARTRTRRLSLGQGRRLGLAAALLGDPGTLILDEPVNGLDPAGIVWMRELLRARAARGDTVLLSSHLMTELSATVDDVVVIDHGRIAAQGTLGEVTAGHASLEAAFLTLTGGRAA